LNAIDRIEQVKSDMSYLINTYGEYDDKFVHDDKNFQQARIIIKKLAKEKGINEPLFIKDARTLDEAVTSIFFSGNSMANEVTLKNYVFSELNQYIDYIEEHQIDVKIVHVACEVPEELTFDHILESIQKCEKRINDEDYSGAVTSAKTLVEGVCKEILQKFPNVTIDNKTDLPALFTKVRQNLNLDPKDPKLDNSLKEVLTGLIKIVNGISEIRNSHGDSHLPKYKIDRHHALVVVNSAKTVVTFLFNTYEYQLDRGTLELAK